MTHQFVSMCEMLIVFSSVFFRIKHSARRLRLPVATDYTVYTLQQSVHIFNSSFEPSY